MSTPSPNETDQQEQDHNDSQSPSTSQTTPSASLSAGPWQAIFSPQYNAYYFYNTSTGETSWVNPLQSPPSHPSSATQNNTGGDPEAEVDSSLGAVNPNPYDPNSLEARAIAAGIDPSLAYLDPSLAGPSSLAPSGMFTAKFNARTGAFTAVDGRAPSHLSEYERMKRMNAFYFDVGAWETEVEERDAEEKAGGGKKRKRPSRKDLVGICLSDFSLFIISFCACSREDDFKIKCTISGRTY